jgi:hypothetical protein
MRRLSDVERIRQLMRSLGRSAKGTATVYLTGGATAVLNGWRPTTIDVDLKMVPDRDEVLQSIAVLKNELEINVELAAPDQFLPPLPGWQDRSEFIAREGLLEFRHYDYYAQALSKLERGHRQDVEDVQKMLAEQKIDPGKLRHLYGEIEPFLYRYPSVDPAGLTRTVDEFVRGRESHP